MLCSAAPSTALASEEWRFFVSHFQTFFTQLLSGQDGASAAEPDSAGARQGSAGATRDSAWAKLSQRQATQSVMHSRTYPAFAALPPARSEVSTAPGLLDSSSAEAGSVREMSGMQRSVVADLLGALHSVFEDLLLDQLLWRHVPHLAALLATLSALAGASDWKVLTSKICSVVSKSRVRRCSLMCTTSVEGVQFACVSQAVSTRYALTHVKRVQEYYMRHVTGSMRCHLLPAAAAEPVTTLAPPLPPPADFTAALQSLVDGTASMQQQEHRLPLPLLVQRGAAIVQRSRDLLAMFRTLSHTLEECGHLVRP